MAAAPTTNEMKVDRARIADVNAEILNLERSLSSLLNERAQMQDRLKSYKYPVSTLSNEVISEIFIHFLPGYPACLLTEGTVSPSPTLLTRICRKWREIALATPALWSGIGWTVTMTPHLLESWLAQSGISPLSILYKMDGHFTRFKISPSGFFQAILAHRTRWQHLELLIEERTQPPLTFFQDTMPSLHHLKLTLETNIRTTLKFLAFRVPLLRSVVLNYLAPVGAAEYAPTLQQAVNLVYCEIHCYDGDRVPHHTGEIHLMYLESLVLGDWDYGEDTPCHLANFVLPALRRLQVAEAFLGMHPIDALATFVSRSRCEVRDACITGRKTTSKSTYRSAFPGISTFIFNKKSTRSYFRDGSDAYDVRVGSDGEETFTESENSSETDEEDWTTESESAS
ncbi:hypothetical protein C8R44DRAFT_727322 [Mycena epipterygia]|nr:hypothetical protein C8R44DRAFT_727322 [Mycena epipterygia]